MPEPIALIHDHEYKPFKLLGENPAHSPDYVWWLERCDGCQKIKLCRGTEAPAVLVLAR